MAYSKQRLIREFNGTINKLKYYDFCIIQYIENYGKHVKHFGKRL